MPIAREWPTKADEARMDTLAIADDGEVLAVELQYANRVGDRVEVARLNKLIFEKFGAIKQYMREAKRK